MSPLRSRLAILALALAAACERAPAPGEAEKASPQSSEVTSEVHELSGPTMGSAYVLKWHGGAEPPVVQSAVEAHLAKTESTFSLWAGNSELARLNAHRSTEPFAASPWLAAALDLALRVAAASDGAFDPTLKPHTDLYKQSKKSGKAPAPEAIEDARARTGHRLVRVDGTAVHKQRPDVELDLDGLVAGFCADRLAERFAELGVRDFMLEITGEVLCRGLRPDGLPWRIGVVDPERSEIGREDSIVSLPVRDRALCTSGDYRNFQVLDGKVVTHVFDPRTGKNPAHGVVSATVLARSCALADALGTALMVVGPSGVEPLLRAAGEPDLAAFVLVADGERRLTKLEFAWPEAFSLAGRPLLRPALAPAAEVVREKDLADALANLQREPDSLGANVWVGRRLAYLGRHRDAVDHFTAALRQFRNEPHLLRHRGHRHLTLRDLEAARADLARAAAAIAGQPDEIEPDGQPVAGRKPHSTLHYNVHYHLGLACFCLRDFAAAEAAWRDCLAVVRNDESRVAVTHWLWCALAQQKKTAEVEELLRAVPASPDVVENVAYLQLCRLYRGDVDAASLRAAGEPTASLAFGLAHFAFVRGEADARSQLEAVAARADWPSFGVLAAESLLQPR